MRKGVSLLFALILSLTIITFPIALHGQDSSSSSSVSSGASDLENKISEYERKLADIRQQKNTLSSQIAEMDTEIYIKTLNIQQTEQKITETQHEIEMLTTRINGLDSSLTNLSKLLIQRIVKGYKEKSLTVFDLLLSTENMGDFVNRIKYQKATQDNNQKLLVQVQEAKSNYEEQKNLRETKKQELDALIVTLGNQKTELMSQQSAKKRLLDVTRNDESTYQQLLDQARKQLSSFSSFVKYAGGGTVGADGLGKGSLGWYMTQRDERWAGRLIGLSDMNIMEVGCLLTDVAMVYTKYGENRTPADIASEVDRYFSNTAMMLVPWRGPGGRSYVGLSTSQIDEELNNNNLVIVGLYAGSYGSHYVILVKKDGDDYLMYDPYYGPDLKFSSRYSLGSIFSAATFK